MRRSLEMREKSGLRCCAKRLAFLGFMTGLFLPAAARAQSAPNLPAGKGKAEFARVCGKCHGVEIIIKKTDTAEGWADVVDDMVSRGAQGTDDDFDLVVKYLAAQFSPKGKVNQANAKELSLTMDDGVRIDASLQVPDGPAPAGGWPAIYDDVAIRTADGSGNGRSPEVPKKTGAWLPTYQAPVDER